MDKEQEILLKVAELNSKLDQVLVSTEKTRRYFFWVLVITALLTLLPLLGTMVFLPKALSGLTASTSL
jgi:hypothetical protein